jgi:hypothetical protein
MMRKLATTFTLTLVALILVAAGGSAAQAASRCSLTTSIAGPTDSVVIYNLQVFGSMNCASARYVINQWFQPQYRRRGFVRLSFYDGYVTWHCANLPGRRYRCRESTSGTSFSFSWRRF